MDAANLQRKTSNSVFLRRKNSYRLETDNQIKADSETVGISSRDCMNFYMLHGNMQANILQNMENSGTMHGNIL